MELKILSHNVVVRIKQGNIPYLHKICHSLYIIGSHSFTLLQYRSSEEGSINSGWLIRKHFTKASGHLNWAMHYGKDFNGQRRVVGLSEI